MRLEPKTPAMLRTRYHEHRQSPSPGPAATPSAPLCAEPDPDAFGEWLAHVEAGRIAVRR